MPIPFEPTKSFCYRVARYELLDQLAQESALVIHRACELSKKNHEKY